MPRQGWLAHEADDEFCLIERGCEICLQRAATIIITTRNNFRKLLFAISKKSFGCV